MLYYIYISENGVPAPVLSPIWHCLYEAKVNGNDLTDLANSSVPIVAVGSEVNPSSGCGWYCFDITFGVGVWVDTTVDLVGVIDAGEDMSDNADRFIPVEISLRNLGLARIAHKGMQNKTTGDIDIYKTDGITKEMKLDFTDSGGNITRNPTVA